MMMKPYSFNAKVALTLTLTANHRGLSEWQTFGKAGRHHAKQRTKLQPNKADISDKHQATAKRVDVVQHVRSQVNVTENSDGNVGQISSNQRTASRHEQTCDPRIRVELLHNATTLVNLHSHRQSTQ